MNNRMPYGYEAGVDVTVDLHPQHRNNEPGFIVLLRWFMS